jgi:hypothetical protein
VTAVATFREGATFTCTRRTHNLDTGEYSEPCGAEIVCHGYWWCSFVCPACLAIYKVFSGNDIVAQHGSWFPDPQKVRDNIARNGGQYVPEFS